MQNQKTPPLTPEAISAMSLNELNDARSDLELTANLIKNSLQEAKQNVYLHANYSNPDWYRRATFALRMKGREMQLLAREMGKRKRARSEENKAASDAGSLTWERNFVRVAKQILDRETYVNICETASKAEGRE